jgi:hypothetical protein
MQKNAPSDLIQSDKFLGFYRGIVEDNKDPDKAGRVRIRVFGLHTEQKYHTETEGIPTEDLPWAEPCLPISEGSISGFGVWSVPLQGSHVMVFFEEGNPNHPMYFASLPGIPKSKSSLQKSIGTQEQDSSKRDGFRDPDGVYPTSHRLGEPDVHRLARGVKDDTLVITKEENLDQSIQIAYGGSWDEPNPAFAARYPHNFVFTTHGGLTVELDSTPGAKRFHIYHPSNTYIECDNDGNIVIRNQADKYEIVLENRYIHIYQDNYRTTDGDERVKVKGTRYIEINEDENRDVNGNKTESIDGELNITVVGKVNITSNTEVNITAPRINLN